MPALQGTPINITRSTADRLADELVAPIPFGKPIQRMAWGLLGFTGDLFASRALYNLVIGVDHGKPEALQSYWKNRAVSFPLLPHPVRAHIIEQINGTYCEIMAKQVRKAVKSEVALRNSPTPSRFTGQKVITKASATYATTISLQDFLKLVPIDFASLEKAAAAAARPINPRNSSSYTKAPERGSAGTFDVQFTISGPELDRAVNTAVSTMVRARVLEDYLSQKSCPVSLATFQALLNLPGDPRAILFSKEVQGIIELNQHLHQNYKAFSTIERAAFVTKYGLKNHPVRYFEKAQRAVLERAEKKRQSMRPTANGDMRITLPETPVSASRMRFSDLTSEVLKTLGKRADNQDVELADLRLIANRIAKFARKTTITVDQLLDLVSVSTDPFEVMAAMVRRPENLDTSSEIATTAPAKTYRSAFSFNLWQAPETFFDRRQRAELHDIFSRFGILEFDELKAILTKYFNTTFSTLAGPGSHGQFTRHTSTKPFTAQASPRFQQDEIRGSLIKVLEETLQDLDIESKAFLDALKKHRKIK